MFSSSGHHSDGIVGVTLEVSEVGISCCWVTELQGGLITSLRTHHLPQDDISYMDVAEAVRSFTEAFVN